LCRAARGGVVAYAGNKLRGLRKSGYVTSPRTHFEIRKNNRMVNLIRQISGRAIRRTARRRKSSLG